MRNTTHISSNTSMQVSIYRGSWYEWAIVCMNCSLDTQRHWAPSTHFNWNKQQTKQVIWMFRLDSALTFIYLGFCLSADLAVLTIYCLGISHNESTKRKRFFFYNWNGSGINFGNNYFVGHEWNKANESQKWCGGKIRKKVEQKLKKKKQNIARGETEPGKILHETYDIMWILCAVRI